MSASWLDLPYANLPRLIERASFIWCNILWHEVFRGTRRARSLSPTRI